MASETKTLGWKEQEIIGDWVLVQYDYTFYPDKVKGYLPYTTIFCYKVAFDV